MTHISPDVGQSFHVCSDFTVINVDMSLDGQPCSRHCHFSTVYSVPLRMDLQEVGCGYMDWIGLAQDRDRWRTLVSAVMNLPVP